MRAITVLVIALAFAAVVVVAVDAAHPHPPPKKAAAAKSKVKPTAVQSQEAKIPGVKRARKSPLKGEPGKHPKFKGKQSDDKFSKRSQNTLGNQAMGKAKPPTKPTAQKPAAQKPFKPSQQQKQKMRFALQQQAGASSAGAGPAYPMRTPTNDGWVISSRYTFTDAQIAAVKALLVPLPEEQTFYHWDTPVACIRWARGGMSEGEIRFFDSQMSGMASGGGLYFSALLNSANYGTFPCRVVIKKGTLQYADNVWSHANLKTVLTKTVSFDLNEKVAFGIVVPFIHLYSTSSQWWVTHSHEVFARFLGGNHIMADGKTLVSPHFDGANNGINIRSSMELYQFWRDVESNKIGLEPQSAAKDAADGLKWLKSFTFLFSYIDMASLYRALKITPQDPFDVFEKQRFPNYQAVYEKYINGRLDKPTEKSLWGISMIDTTKFGAPGLTADQWADNQLKVVLPGLYKELSQGGVMKFRDCEVRAGGDEEGRTFSATSGQVAEMRRNPYLYVVDGPVDPTTQLSKVYYYYPDPFHRTAALKPRVSAALWTECDDLLRLALAAGPAGSAGFEAFKSQQAFKDLTVKLMTELILEAFKRVHNQYAQMDYGGYQIMLDLVGIHPCTDFNGRTTRFYGVVAAIEAGKEPPIASMSDFDLTTPATTYKQMLTAGSAAYLKLKIALTGELFTGVCNNKVPDHYGVSYWSLMPSEAMKPLFSTPAPWTYDDSDLEDIAKRRFVKLMDKKLGAKWTGRVATVPTPTVQKPGDFPVIPPPPPKQ